MQRKITDELMQEIISSYESGKSIYQIAEEYKFHSQTIWRNFKKRKIKLRDTWAHKTINIPTTELTDTQKEIIEGCLLGDGSVFIKTTAYFQIECVEQELIEHLANSLPFIWRRRTRIRNNVEIRGKLVKTKPAYSITSRCDKSLNEFNHRWYLKDEKVVPKDLICTPTSFRHWFYGDGSTSYVTHKGKNLGTQLTFCSNCFTYEDCEFLKYKLLEICNTTVGVYDGGRGAPVLKTTKIESVKNFFDYIGQSELECYNYKWKIPEYQY